MCSNPPSSTAASHQILLLKEGTGGKKRQVMEPKPAPPPPTCCFASLTSTLSRVSQWGGGSRGDRRYRTYCSNKQLNYAQVLNTQALASSEVTPPRSRHAASTSPTATVLRSETGIRRRTPSRGFSPAGGHLCRSRLLIPSQLEVFVIRTGIGGGDFLSWIHASALTRLILPVMFHRWLI